MTCILDDSDLLDYIFDDTPIDVTEYEIAPTIDSILEHNSKEHGLYPLENKPYIESSRPWRDKTIENKLPFVNAVKGDDEITFERTGIIGLTMIAVCEAFLNIKISWKDTGINEYMGNYAEEWILKPLTQQSSYYESSMYGKGNFVPWTLDNVKLKMLSPVRKQSQLEDDLHSKMTTLANAASWVNPSWFTYNFHQLSIILAIENFDFESANVFPFLAREEGGSGCPVPWNQPKTLLNYTDSYKRGVVRDAILQIMYESDLIRKSQLKPLQAFGIKGMHAYKSGNIQVWRDYVEKAYSLITYGISDYEIKEFIFQTLDLNIPSELNQLAEVVDIANPAIASGISRLRQSNEILTDSDLVKYMKTEERRAGLFDNKPFSQLLLEQEIRDEKARSQPLNVLNTLMQKMKLSQFDYSFQLQDTPINIVTEYMKGLSRYAYFLTSFNFSSKVRIYRTQDVENYFQSSNTRTLQETVFEKTYNTPMKFRRVDMDPLEITKWEAIKKWLHSANPFSQTIPVGIATDDARLIDQISKIERSSLLIIISNDLALQGPIETFIRIANKNSVIQHLFAFLPVDHYYFICNENRHKPHYSGRDEFYNILSSECQDIITYFKVKYCRNLRQILKERKWNFQENFYFIYDSSNIARFAPKIQFLNHSKFEIDYNNYLPTKEVENLNRTQSSISLIEPDKVYSRFFKRKKRIVVRRELQLSFR